MRAVFKGFIAASLIAGSSLAATAPAEARNHTGTALLAGVIGLGIGAAIVSDNHNDRGYYSSSSDYYGSGYAPNYYATPSVSYYDGGYGYNSGYGYQRDYGRQYGRGEYNRGGDRRGWQNDRRGHDDWRNRDDRRDDRDNDRGGWDRR
jgi:hypothetical protein